LDECTVFVRVRRNVTAFMAALILMATVGVVFSAAQPARADTVFASGQVFISTGFGEVDVYDPASGNMINSLIDATNSQFVAGTAFDANGNIFVADGTSGNISEFDPMGNPIGTFASGLADPAALVFDRAGNLYVGQLRSHFIAEFAPNGQRQTDIGPLKTQLFGNDWIDLSSDQCTFYYTSERSAVMAYNMCTKTQLPDFTQQPLAGGNAYELRIVANGPDVGDVLVADSNRVVRLDASGNVKQSYLCSSLPGCAGQLFGLAVSPDGTSFWASDPFSGLVWQVDIASGQVLQLIDPQSAFLYGLSVAGEVTAATAGATTVAATPTSLVIQPVSGNFSSPTPVSAVLTDSTTNTPIAGEPVTFTLNGNETCTATTDSTGTATCVITPSEPSQSYTLTASFSGDSTQSTPIGSGTGSNTFTVNPDTSSLTYTGPTSGVNGQPLTLTGDLTTDTPTTGTPLPTQVVTFTIGTAPTTQSCTNTTDTSGQASCIIPVVNQPTSDVPVTATYTGGNDNTPATTSTTATITEPTTLTVHAATGDYADATAVSATLSDAVTNAPIAGETVQLNMGAESCSAPTDANGVASCSITPSEAAGTYPLSGSFSGDTLRPLELTGSNNSANFVVTLEESALTYTGATVAHNGQPLSVSGVLTTDDPGAGAPIAGRSVTFVLGSGASAQSCSGVTDSTGTAACSIASVNQSPGPIPVTDTFASDGHYKTASASSTVNLPEGTALVINPTSGTYSGPTTLSGTLENTYTSQPVPGESVTLTINGTQSCTATTNASGVASCTVTPNEPAGTYSFTASFPGDTGSMPQLLSSDQTSDIVVTQAPTTLTYSGPTSLTNGSPATFSGSITSSEPTSGTDVSGATVTFTIGSGSSQQSCTATSDASGNLSCTIANVNQTSGTVPITESFSGNNYYASSTDSSSATVHTPTTLTVSATTGTYGSPTTLTGDLTNAVTGQPIANEPVTLTLNGTQSCVGTTNTSGIATCSVTPNEPAGSYTASGSFGGQSSSLSQPALNPSGGSNTVVVTKAPTTVVNTSPTIVVTGGSVTLSGTVSTTGGSGPGGLPVTLTLGSGSTGQSCTGIANAAGQVSCTIATVTQTSGTLPVTVSVGGNSFYQSSSTSSTVIVAAEADTGGFVVGDSSAGATTTARLSGWVSNGNNVNFWGSQLWKKNVFTGVNNSPASMKGYIDQAPIALGVNPATTCGKNWTSDPGNSSNPPASVPLWLIVVVSSSISQTGSTENGDIKHVAVVQVQPGYGPAPGHDGFGKVAYWLC
jgi:hypothetical protein